MERDHTNSTPLLLSISGTDLPDLYDALTAHSELLDKEGDHLGAARMMAIVNRISNLQTIEIETSRQALIALRLGFGRNGLHG